jgi:N-acetylmuramoyl-L-alanine amidase
MSRAFVNPRAAIMILPQPSEFDIEIVARTAWMEARGEPREGRRAVIHAIINRHLAGRWYSGATLAGTCLKPRQFSCWNENDANREKGVELDAGDLLLGELRKLVVAALDGSDPDPTDFATHYYSTSMPLPPEWAKTGRLTVELGRHRFYADMP